MQMKLLQRVDQLTPQDLQAANTIPPAAVQVLKKLLPEIGFLLDMIGKPGGMTPDAPQMQQPGAFPPPGTQATSNPVPGLSGPPGPGSPSGLSRPATKLGGI